MAEKSNKLKKNKNIMAPHIKFEKIQNKKNVLRTHTYTLIPLAMKEVDHDGHSLVEGTQASTAF